MPAEVYIVYIEVYIVYIIYNTFKNVRTKTSYKGTHNIVAISSKIQLNSRNVTREMYHYIEVKL